MRLLLLQAVGLVSILNARCSLPAWTLCSQTSAPLRLQLCSFCRRQAEGGGECGPWVTAPPQIHVHQVPQCCALGPAVPRQGWGHGRACAGVRRNLVAVMYEKPCHVQLCARTSCTSPGLGPRTCMRRSERKRACAGVGGNVLAQVC